MRHTPGRRRARVVPRGDPRFRELAEEVGATSGFWDGKRIPASFFKIYEVSWIRLLIAFTFLGAIMVTLPIWLPFLLNRLPLRLLTSPAMNILLNFFMPIGNSARYIVSPLDFFSK